VSIEVHDYGLGVWDAVAFETLPDDSTVSLEKRSLKISAHNLDVSPRLVTVQVLDAKGHTLSGLWVKPQDIKDMAAEIERREEHEHH